MCSGSFHLTLKFSIINWLMIHYFTYERCIHIHIYIYTYTIDYRYNMLKDQRPTPWEAPLVPNDQPGRWASLGAASPRRQQDHDIPRSTTVKGGDQLPVVDASIAWASLKFEGMVVPFTGNQPYFIGTSWKIHNLSICHRKIGWKIPSFPVDFPGEKNPLRKMRGLHQWEE